MFKPKIQRGPFTNLKEKMVNSFGKKIGQMFMKFEEFHTSTHYYLVVATYIFFFKKKK